MLNRANRLPFTQISYVLKTGQRIEESYLRLHINVTSNSQSIQWSVQVPKKVIPGAVERNRAKRMIREALRFLIPQMVSVSGVIRVVRPIPPDSKTDSVTHILKNLLDKAQVLQ